jgi:hypothetical protein
MKTFTLLPATTVVRHACWSSTGYRSSRPSAAIEPQLAQRFLSLYGLALLSDGQLAHFSVCHQRTRSLWPLHNIPLAALKSP